MHGTEATINTELLERALEEVEGAKLCVHRNGLSYRPRKFHVLTGLGPGHNLGVFHNNVDAIGKAFLERYFMCAEGQGFRPALPVTRNFESAHLQEFRRVVIENMHQLPRLSRQQVVDRYSGRKFAIYDNANKSLCSKSFTHKDSRLTSFVKFEKQDVGKAPRIINPRTPRFNLLLGQYLKHAEKPFFKAINVAYGDHTAATVIKGFNADKSAAILFEKWNRFRKPCAVGLDATKFDMHVSEDALRYEHSFYHALFPGSGGRKLRALLRMQLRNSGHAHASDGRIDFAMRGTRASGDLNTSLGNCIIMCALVHVYARSRGVDIELANNGDDCVVFMASDDETAFRRGLDDWFRARGFAMVAEPTVYEFEQVEFCQTHPVKLIHGWRMVRNHLACLRKDPMCLIPISNEKALRKWVKAVGECGTQLAGSVPVQGSFYNAFERAAGPLRVRSRHRDEIFRNTSMQMRVQGIKSLPRMVTPESRVSYYYAFGILPSEQEELERFYDQGTIDLAMPESVVTRDAVRFEPGLISLLQYV